MYHNILVRERRELQFSCVSEAFKRDLMCARAEIYFNGTQQHYRVHAQMAKKMYADAHGRKFNRVQMPSCIFLFLLV